MPCVSIDDELPKNPNMVLTSIVEFGDSIEVIAVYEPPFGIAAPAHESPPANGLIKSFSS